MIVFTIVLLVVLAIVIVALTFTDNDDAKGVLFGFGVMAIMFLTPAIFIKFNIVFKRLTISYLE